MTVVVVTDTTVTLRSKRGAVRGVQLANAGPTVGIAHGDIRDLPPMVGTVDLADSDGTVLRFAFDNPTAPNGFLGVDFTLDGPVPYYVPRLAR